MAGHKDAIVSYHVALQPTPGLYSDPGAADQIAISSPDNGPDAVTADDPTLTGSIWATPRQFLGRRGRAGATLALRGPGGNAPPALGAFVTGRILQAAGLVEVRNGAEIIGTAAGGSTTSLTMEAGASSVDDFYKGFPIEHDAIGTGPIRRMSMVRDYVGATRSAVLAETLGSAIAGGSYRIPPGLFYLLGNGSDIPLLSVKVVRHRKAYRYRDCALSSFALNIPVANLTSTDAPTIEFAMVGVPLPEIDEMALAIPDRLLTPVPVAKAGKFALNGIKVGHQSLRIEFGLETGAPPNQNFDEGQESYEVMSGTRTLSLDVNQTLQSQLQLDTLVDNQTVLSILSSYGLGIGQRVIAGIPDAVLDPFSPTGRQGFVGMTGTAIPLGTDRAVAINFTY